MVVQLFFRKMTVKLGMRILVVEDEHRIAQAIKKGLEQENYAVDLAFDGEEGLDLATSEEYDVILLDVMLPKLDGTEICKNIRKQKIHTPVLMLTAKTQTQDKVVGLDAGADDYLSKPFSFEELLARIRALLRRPKDSLSEVLACGSLEMDKSKFEVTRNKKVVRLSSREFSLLEYFLRNCGRTLSKEQIRDHVWNFESDILPNTVEVYIKNLRAKLGKPEMLKTVMGFGYRLEADV